MRRVAAPAYADDVGRQSATPSLGDEVRRLARNWSVELTPRETERFGTAVREHVPAGTCVYITWLTGTDFAPSVAAAAKLRAAGLEPVPHLAARAIRDKDTLDDMLVRLRGEADVRQVLVIGGALREPKGSFDASIPGAPFRPVGAPRDTTARSRGPPRRQPRYRTGGPSTRRSP